MCDHLNGVPLLISPISLAIWGLIAFTSFAGTIFSVKSRGARMVFALPDAFVSLAVALTFFYQIVWAYVPLVIIYCGMKGWVVMRTSLRADLEKRIKEVIDEADPEAREVLTSMFKIDYAIPAVCFFFICFFLGAYIIASLNG